MIRRALIALAFLLAPFAARADERVTDFDVLIEVQKSGDILVTETIAVNAEGDAIRRGIFRDLPRYHLKGARKLPYYYDIWKVSRNGEREYYLVELDGNAFRIRIGEADVFLNPGPHQYVIAYMVRNQVRYFGDHDEVYWNATGNYWSFPIDRARVRVKLPEGADATQLAAYTGSQGATERDYAYRFEDETHLFDATRPLAPGEGLTIAVGFAKGVVDPPSAADTFGEWWTANAALVILGAAALLIGALYAFLWRRIGRDPAKGPVFPRYEPPAGLSPAAVHQIYYRGAKGYTALTASLINLGVKKRLRIDTKKKETVLTRLADGDAAALADFETRLEADLFGSAQEVSFGGKYNAAVTTAYTQLSKALSRLYGAPYFKWNRGFLLLGVLLSVGATVLAVKFVIAWTLLHTLFAGALIVMAIAAAYFLPAPTTTGQDTRTEIEGFRLYLETAEKLQLNAVEIGSDATPPMTIERYERFLPYAVALGVEKPWTEHFEKLMPKEAADYQPYWSTSHHGGGRSLSSVNSALVSGLSSGVASSMPQSSSSSGSSGGGSSGGGGGGGGGGGW